MGTISCHSNQSSYPTGIKNITFRSPYLKMLYMCNMERILLMASEEMSFENVDGRGTDDGCLYILQAHLGAECSGELIKTDLKSSASSNFPPLHLKNPKIQDTRYKKLYLTSTFKSTT